MTDLAAFPRVHLAHLPTPLEPMDRVSKLLGGPRLCIKRDDCTGLATGGNKARKLEFVLADAVGRLAEPSFGIPARVPPPPAKHNRPTTIIPAETRRALVITGPLCIKFPRATALLWRECSIARVGSLI